MWGLLYFLGFLWATPLSLVGLLLAKLWGCKRDGPVWISDKPFPGPWRGYVGITVGWVIMLAPRHNAMTFEHELVHVKQCLVLGPLMPLAYAVAAVWAWAGGGHWYQDNAFERQARRLAGQKV